jgi:hypothetical protein
MEREGRVHVSFVLGDNVAENRPGREFFKRRDGKSVGQYGVHNRLARNQYGHEA